MVRYPNLKLIYLVRCGNYNFSLWVIMSLFLIKKEKNKTNKNKTEMAIRQKHPTFLGGRTMPQI